MVKDKYKLFIGNAIDLLEFGLKEDKFMDLNMDTLMESVLDEH